MTDYAFQLLEAKPVEEAEPAEALAATFGYGARRPFIDEARRLSRWVNAFGGDGQAFEMWCEQSLTLLDEYSTKH